MWLFTDPPIPDNEIYENYALSWMHLSTMSNYRKQLATRYVQHFDLSGKTILDVGCGAGEFMQCLADQGGLVEGIEPSEMLVQRGRSRGHRIIHDFVRTGTFPEAKKYHGFTCLQVLEHVDDPVGFLMILRNCLEPEGIGLVEVPALERICEDRRLYEFFVDHVSYFTERTLRLSCELAGFRVLRVDRSFEDQFHVSLIIPDMISVSTFHCEMLQALDEARKWVRAQAAEHKCVAAWGAGYKSTAALAELNLPELLVVIDSDPGKHGLYSPVSHLRVVSPSYLQEASIGAVLITAVGYKHEILRQIRETIGFTGPVAALGKTLEIL